MTSKFLLKQATALLATIFLMHGTASLAAEQTPEQVINQTSKRILQEIEPRKDELRKDSAKLYQIVEDIIVPNFDFDTISRRVLGKAWKNASEDQRVRFSAAFKNLLIRTYSNALLEYSGEDIKWATAKTNEDGSKVMQQAEITLSSGQTIPMVWGLHQVNKQWKVYDISIDGISLVTNYRSVFAGEVRKNGIDALIQRLESKNEGDTKKS